VRFDPIAEPLPVHEAEQPANVTRLDRYRDRDDDPPARPEPDQVDNIT
jgi:hypothetical protein